MAKRDGRVRLRYGQVVAIRKARREGATMAQLAKRFSVGKTTVQDILEGRTWVHALELGSLEPRSKRDLKDAVHIPADEAEATIGEYIRTKVFDEIADKIRASIRAQFDASAERLKNARQDVERLTEELESLRRERQRLVRLAAATDEPIPEVIAALKENQARATAHERAVAIAKRPPIDGPIAERLEANAVEQVQKMRERLASSALREATRALFPKGLRFKIKNGLWLIEGAASVPGVGHPDA